MSARSLLETLVGINSISGSEQEIAIWLENFLEENGFRTERHPLSHAPERWNICGEKGDTTDPCILFYGHMDTVEVAKDWESDPCTVLEDGDKLIGLGVNDMKGGLAAILSAIQGFNPNGFKLKVVFGADEELFSAGAFVLAESGWLKDVDFCIVPEIGDSAKERSGNLPNTMILGRRGRVSVQVDLYGKSAHGAVPQKGHNAVEALCDLLPQVKSCLLSQMELDTEKNWKGDVFCASFSGGANFLSIPEKASFILSRHFLPSRTAKDCVNEVQECINNLSLPPGISISPPQPMERPTPYLEAFVTPEDNPFVKKLGKLLDQRYGNHNIEYGLSVADENVIGQYITATVILGPVGGKSHQAGEWVSQKSLEELTAVFKEILRDFPSWF